MTLAVDLATDRKRFMSRKVRRVRGEEGGKKQTRQRNSSKIHYSEIMRGSITLDGFSIGFNISPRSP